MGFGLLTENTISVRCERDGLGIGKTGERRDVLWGERALNACPGAALTTICDRERERRHVEGIPGSAYRHKYLSKIILATSILKLHID